MTVHEFSFPTRVRFGPGASREVRAHLEAAGCRRPLVVTDRGLAPLPVLREFLGGLAPLAVSAFHDFAGNPLDGHVAAGTAAFRAHEADAIVGIGGGAALDVAKAIALMARHPGAILDYEDGKPDARPVDREIPHWVAVPTTAGTGSEVGRSAVISDERTRTKRIVFHPRLMARAVFADPELTLGLPPAVTAATGMDAITHCVESYLAKGYHPVCDGVALEGLRIGARALPRCVATPRDLAARSDMLMASMMGAIAFQKGLGVVHSCAHALSAVADLHHGLANGVMIDHALPMNVAAREERFREMARVVSAKDETPAGFFAWLTDLKAVIGIPPRLSGAGVAREHVERLPAAALADSCHANNPVPCTIEDFRRAFARAA